MSQTLPEGIPQKTACAGNLAEMSDFELAEWFEEVFDTCQYRVQKSMPSKFKNLAMELCLN